MNIYANSGSWKYPPGPGPPPPPLTSLAGVQPRTEVLEDRGLRVARPAGEGIILGGFQKNIFNWLLAGQGHAYIK